VVSCEHIRDRFLRADICCLKNLLQ